MSSFPELYFNVDSGYLEGLVRGFKAGVLSQGDYVNLVQCESLEDLKLHLQSTDYGNFLANEASPLTVSVIDDKLKEKMVVEFRHMRNHAYEPLASFLDFITYSYMIDNVILLITGTLHQRSIAELVPKCHPLGSFEQMEAVNIAQTPAELYNAILVDTPLAAFFQDCISEQDLDEMNIEIIRNTLYKVCFQAEAKHGAGSERAQGAGQRALRENWGCHGSPGPSVVKGRAEGNECWADAVTLGPKREHPILGHVAFLTSRLKALVEMRDTFAQSSSCAGQHSPRPPTGVPFSRPPC
ncbi:V-type proton ATPase subunit d 1 isoform X2 [Lepidochelys kempii]|uniref:V-type proton ATPase subunit d 1 isoform X2 n=1 Tax=Lepidochelys kempii TaxID=8472 RepID=UPI003C6FA212